MDRYQETFKTWNKLAEVYQDKFMNLDLYNETYDAFLSLLNKKNATVLDVGCGPGNITKYLLFKNAALKIKGIDISENMVALAKKNNPLAGFEVLDSREIDSLTEKFDAIICGFCIPYLSQTDCEKLIVDCKNLLKKAGILNLSFVAGDYNGSGFIARSSGDKVYFQYHNLDTLEKELKANSFATEEIFLKKYTKADGVEEEHTIILLKKQGAN